MILVALLRLAGCVTAAAFLAIVPPSGMDGVNAPMAGTR